MMRSSPRTKLRKKPLAQLDTEDAFDLAPITLSPKKSSPKKSSQSSPKILSAYDSFISGSDDGACLLPKDLPRSPTEQAWGASMWQTLSSLSTGRREGEQWVCFLLLRKLETVELALRFDIELSVLCNTTRWLGTRRPCAALPLPQSLPNASYSFIYSNLSQYCEGRANMKGNIQIWQRERKREKEREEEGDCSTHMARRGVQWRNYWT